jgi:hypothetical protein
MPPQNYWVKKNSLDNALARYRNIAIDYQHFNGQKETCNNQNNSKAWFVEWQ